jgi:predicted GIY-YIG superfamily endonuclease
MFWSKKQKQDPGTVYLGESTRQDGSKQIYTGMTRRPVWTRWREHMKGQGGKYTSSGTWFKPLAAFRSSNPRKAEQTVKHFSASKKRSFAGFIARRYKEKRGFW